MMSVLRWVCEQNWLKLRSNNNNYNNIFITDCNNYTYTQHNVHVCMFMELCEYLLIRLYISSNSVGFSISNRKWLVIKSIPKLHDYKTRLQKHVGFTFLARVQYIKSVQRYTLGIHFHARSPMVMFI